MKGPRAWLGEFVGTFGFVTIACGSVIVATSGIAQIGLFGVATAQGLAFAVMITIFAAVSGGHLNPAVTLSAWVGRRIETADAIGYVVAQIAGALAAAGMLRGIFTEAQWRVSKIGIPAVSSGLAANRALLIEAAFTFFLVLAVWGTSIDERGPRVGGFATGLTLFTSILVIGGSTGAGLNPARFLGPALLGGGLHDWWIYVAGPAIGGIVASLYGFFFLDAQPPWARVAAPPAAEVTGIGEPAAVRKPAPRRKPAARKPTRGV